MKKLICVLLAGAVILGVCACDKKNSRKNKKSRETKQTYEEVEEEPEKTTASEESEETTETTKKKKVEINLEDNYWFIDVTDEATMKKLVDALIACEPQLNDVCSGEREDVGKRVADGFGKKYSGYGLFSNARTFNFEYGSENRTDIINGRDHISTLGYTNYNLEKLEGHLNFRVAGYKEAHSRKERPGSGSVTIVVYDEDRAKACRDILVDYLKEVYKDDIKSEKEFKSGNYYLNYGEKLTDSVAEVIIQKCEGKNGSPDYWQVHFMVSFNTENMMNAGTASSETTSSEPSETT